MTYEPFSIRTCAHYQGPQTFCRVGVDVEETRDRDGRLACCVIRGITSSTGCDYVRLPAPPPDEELGSMTTALQALIEDRCPVCGDPMRGQLQLGTGEVIAMPCEHSIRGAL